MAVCIDRPKAGGRTFLSPEEVATADVTPVIPDDLTRLNMGKNTKNFSTALYGLSSQIDLYTPRQLAVLAAFADEVANVADHVFEGRRRREPR